MGVEGRSRGGGHGRRGGKKKLGRPGRPPGRGVSVRNRTTAEFPRPPRKAKERSPLPPSRRALPAALTLLRAYAAAAFPSQRLPGWGSYEGWSDLVRSTVVWLGLPDPAQTRAAPGASADGEKGALLDLIHDLAELLAAIGSAATSNEVLRRAAP